MKPNTIITQRRKPIGCMKSLGGFNMFGLALNDFIILLVVAVVAAVVGAGVLK